MMATRKKTSKKAVNEKVRKGVHQHEAEMHAGKPKTKLKLGKKRGT